MLVLSRETSQRVMIDDNIVITIVSIRGNKVRIGIDAPDGVRVDREEVRRAILRDQRKRGGK